MAVLTTEQKREIVEALACYKRPAEVVVLMREDHGVETDVKQVVTYDPTRATYTAGDDLRVIFEVTRKSYLEDVQSVPIANQGYRLKILQNLLDKQLGQGNTVAAANTLEQAAKEVGGILTNERNLNVDSKKGGHSELTPEERRAMVTDMLRQALDAKREEQKTITVEVKDDEPA